jgi:hypothetical protein
MLEGQVNPEYLRTAVRASNGLIRLALGDSFHQRMRKEKPYVEFFDEEIEGTVNRRPLVISTEVIKQIKHNRK